MYKYKVYNLVEPEKSYEKELPYCEGPHMICSRKEFLEKINDWNRIAVLQASVDKRIHWLYVAE